MKTSKSPQQLLELAFQLLSAGQLKEAQRACRKAVQARPDLPEAHLLLSEIHRQGGDAAKAGEAASRALRLRAGWSEAYVALGNAEALAGNARAAEDHYGRALELDPSFSAALLNDARELIARGRNAEAIAALFAVLKRGPAARDPREELLRALHADRRFAEMETVAREGMSLDPASLAFVHQLGVSLWWQGRHEDAIAAFDRIDGMAPDRTGAAYQAAKLDQAACLLGLGRSREGWEAYRWRSTRRAWCARFPELVDDPRAVARMPRGRLSIIGEQGLGDELFFLRFAIGLRQSGHRLSGRFDRKLLPLLARIPDLFERLVSLEDPATIAADATILSGDLPLASGQDSAPPLALPVDADRRAKFEARLRDFGPPPYIGATWRAGAFPDERNVPGMFYLTKEIPPESLGATLRPLNASIIVLQRRPSADDRQRFTAALGRPALDLSSVNDDLEDALALLSILDDYVGVSNTNTHLRAGCPGKTARVLVHYNPEWRWGLRNARSTWFPDFSVYRESAANGWTSTLQRLSSDLARAIAA